MTKEGYIEKVIYSNETNGYAVFTVEGEDGEDVFVGTLFGVNEGMYIEAEGEYIEHPQYDIQFKFNSYKLKMPDECISIEKYLGSGMIRGIGEALSKRIVKKFKTDTFRIIEEEPERLAEIRGISERMARDIAVSYNEKKEMRDSLIFLTGYGISVSLSVKIYNEYGNKLYDVLRTNPYRVAEDISGIGFRTADDIAGKMGIDKDSEYRIRAALIYTLSEAGRLGHMYLPKEKLIYRTQTILDDGEASAETDMVLEQLMQLTLEGKLIIRQTDSCVAVYSPDSFYNEMNTARKLLDLNITFPADFSDLSKKIEEIELTEEIKLEDTQRDAVINAVKNGVAVITGGPGTGKTTIINTLIRIFSEQRMKIMLAAPTGRAAKRMTETTGRQAQTIHRLLELSGAPSDDEERDTYRFIRNASNPLDTDVIIVDEVSMADSIIFENLLAAIVPGTHLILVGDANQLPSVGPGNVLRDIIASGEFSVSVLTHIFRQEEGSDIITNAHMINQGERLSINNKSKDFFYIPRRTPQDIINELNLLITRKLPTYFGERSSDIQVLTPMRKYELGVENLNMKLQEIQNPSGRGLPEKSRGDIIFRQSDKVMQIKNNYKQSWKIVDEKNGYVIEEGVGIFNGDMGFIREIDDYNQVIKVEFDDGRISDYAYTQLDELEHAYAITIHKAQGSEYPVVIIPLYNVPPKLLNRNLLYTAVTRARKGVVMVGNIGLVDRMIENHDEQKRYTSLAERLKEMSKGIE